MSRFEAITDKERETMPKLMREDPKTPEGKYPIVLRRDGTVVEFEYFVLALKDPCTARALTAYAEEAHRQKLDPDYVASVQKLAERSVHLSFTDETREGGPTADPGAPTEREDDPALLAWARSVERA